jgi:HEAT repeat protein
MKPLRQLMSASLLALVLAGSVSCKEPDPYSFETHIDKIRDPAKRASGFTGLEELTKTVVTSPDNKARLDEFATKVIPVFEEVWDSAPEQQEKMLLMLRDAARPEGYTIWNKALALDGSAEARKRSILALEGIRKAKAVGSLDVVIEQLDKLIANPKNDQGSEEENGRVRMLMCETLGVLGDKKAVDILVKVLAQPHETQPTTVHRAAATALGQIGDPGANNKAVDALLTVAFRVPDFATSKNIGVRSKQALVAIGDPAIPRVIDMMRGKHEEVQKLAAAASANEEGEGVNQFTIAQTAANILGSMGSPKAVDALLEMYPTKDCTAPAAPAEKKPKEGEEEEEEGGGEEIAFAQLRAFIANALGNIGDAKPVDVLCQCSMATKNPGDMAEILMALGKIGGSKAVDCLLAVIEKGEYSADAVEKDFKYEPRWDSGRFAILAATPADLPKVKAAIAAVTEPRVKKEMEQWSAGLAAAEKCGSDKNCWLGIVKDSNGDWFAREKAAVELSKLGDGDAAIALEIAKAYKVRSPDARITMAWLPAKMLHGKPCQDCAKAIETVLEAEKLSTDKMYQAAVLMARDTIAKLDREDPNAPAAPAPKK